MNITLIALALLPVLILLLFVYRKDKVNKEPLTPLLKAFFGGIFCALPAAFLESFISLFAPGQSAPVLNGIFQGFVVAGFSEELFKLIIFLLVIWRSQHFDEYFDGIVYATFVSLGFAAIENIMYVFGQSDYFQAISTGTMRAILSIPGHFFFGVVMGYYLALAKFQPHHRFSNLLKALLFPILLHGTFDALLMIPEGFHHNQGLIASLLFAAFLWFDLKLWRIGGRKLHHLQQLSQQQASEDPFHDINFDNSDHSSSSSNSHSDPFSGINWDV